MIDNEERRAAVARLRQFLSKPWDERSWYHDGLQNVGSLVGTSVGENIVARLADLIDRPTCFDKESKSSKFFTCSACGFSDSQVTVSPFTLEIRYVKPSYNYCPNCGAEVAE